VRDYYRRYALFNDAKIIGLELEILFPLDPDARSQMRGFIDRLARSTDGVWQIHDYKTNSCMYGAVLLFFGDVTLLSSLMPLSLPAKASFMVQCSEFANEPRRAYRTTVHSAATIHNDDEAGT
jgi:RecB family exonuclease